MISQQLVLIPSRYNATASPNRNLTKDPRGFRGEVIADCGERLKPSQFKERRQGASYRSQVTTAARWNNAGPFSVQGKLPRRAPDRSQVMSATRGNNLKSFYLEGV
jgi:hypothetical protein